MNEKLFYQKYKAFNESDEDIKKSLETIKKFEHFLGKDVESTTIEDIKTYIDHLIGIKKNKYHEVIHLARYYYYVNMQENYIHMTKYFNGLGVLENIIERILLYDNKETQLIVIKNLELPPFGTDPRKMPMYTHQFIKKMFAEIDVEKCKKILAGNNHNIPDQSFFKEKEYYQKAASLKAYLKDRHQRKVSELKEFYDQNRIWFEQIITPDVIEFVGNNQEILSGVLENDKIYVTKIPYDINRYLNSKNDKERQYYACHCSFVRENILNKTEDIPREWCYCSGGFAKRPFEVIFDQALDVELLETAIDGDDICRFAIDVSNVNYKKA